MIFFVLFLVSGKRKPTTNDFRVIENKTLEYSKIKFYDTEILVTNTSFVKKRISCFKSGLFKAVFVLVKPEKTRLFVKSRQIAYDVQGSMLQFGYVRLPLCRKLSPYSLATNVGLRYKIPFRT